MSSLTKRLLSSTSIIPSRQKLPATIGAPDLDDPRGIAVQFRYAFVVDRYGLKTLDVADLAHPKMTDKGRVSLGDARNVYVARTYAYVADGRFGVSVVDVENPERPHYDQMFGGNGQMNDAYDVKIGMVAGSAFAFVADGMYGLRIWQIVSPWDDAAHFSRIQPAPQS